jgi:hypothetical protein
MKTIKYQIIDGRKLKLCKDESFTSCHQCDLHKESPTTSCMISDKDNHKLECRKNRIYKIVKI